MGERREKQPRKDANCVQIAMELEHTNLGLHCNAVDCNQRDFLPFKCDSCRRDFCLLHRTYTAHGCSGADMKDMTSIDCPICGKGVKFSKAECPDEVWTKHYESSCSGTPVGSKKIAKCFKISCTTILGLSNKFNCSKCRQDVCLSHRNPEDHDCKGIRGAVLSSIAPKSVGKSFQFTSTAAAKSGSGGATAGFAAVKKPEHSTNAKPAPRPTFSATSAAAKSTPQAQPRIVIEREMEPSSFSCPFCSLCMTDAASLTSHVNSDHPDPSRAAPSMSTRPVTPPNSLSGRPPSSSSSSSPYTGGYSGGVGGREVKDCRVFRVKHSIFEFYVSVPAISLVINNN